MGVARAGPGEGEAEDRPRAARGRGGAGQPAAGVYQGPQGQAFQGHVRVAERQCALFLSPFLGGIWVVPNTFRDMQALLFEKRAKLEPVEDAASLDTLSIQVLAAHEQFMALRQEEDALLLECFRVAELNRSALRRLSNTHDEPLSADQIRLLREQSALLTVFRALILQSQIDWSKDDVIQGLLLKSQ